MNRSLKITGLMAVLAVTGCAVVPTPEGGMALAPAAVVAPAPVVVETAPAYYGPVVVEEYPVIAVNYVGGMRQVVVAGPYGPIVVQDYPPLFAVYVGMHLHMEHHERGWRYAHDDRHDPRYDRRFEHAVVQRPVARVQAVRAQRPAEDRKREVAKKEQDRR